MIEGFVGVWLLCFAVSETVAPLSSTTCWFEWEEMVFVTQKECTEFIEKRPTNNAPFRIGAVGKCMKVSFSPAAHLGEEI